MPEFPQATREIFPFEPSKVVTYLEMTAPDQLRPARPAEGVALEPVDNEASLIRPVHDRIAAPHEWSSLTWSQQAWRDNLATSGLRHWVIAVHGEVGGLVALAAQGREVEVVLFGLVPELVGKGYGGHALTLAVRLAWTLEPPVDRVWLHTSTLDHPHALPNYLSRGFSPFRTETRRQGIPG